MFKSIIRRWREWRARQSEVQRLALLAQRRHEEIKRLERQMWVSANGSLYSEENTDYPWEVTSWTVQLPASDEWPEVIGE